MATKHHGKSGSVKINDGTTTSDVECIRSWSLTQESQQAEANCAGEDYADYLTGLIDGSGSMTMVLDTDATQQLNLVNGAELDVELYENSTPGSYYSATIVITSVQSGISYDAVVTKSVNFRTRGTVTYNSGP